MMTECIVPQDLLVCDKKDTCKKTILGIETGDQESYSIGRGGEASFGLRCLIMTIAASEKKITSLAQQ